MLELLDMLITWGKHKALSHFHSACLHDSLVHISTCILRRASCPCEVWLTPSAANLLCLSCPGALRSGVAAGAWVKSAPSVAKTFSCVMPVLALAPLLAVWQTAQLICFLSPHLRRAAAAVASMVSATHQPSSCLWTSHSPGPGIPLVPHTQRCCSCGCPCWQPWWWQWPALREAEAKSKPSALALCSQYKGGTWDTNSASLV